jgi:hypothetical protein
MNMHIIFAILASVLITSVILIIEQQVLALKITNGALYRTEYTAKFYITFENRCWHEIYIRMSDRDDSHIGLQSITYEKDPKEKVTYMKVILPFDSKKLESDRFRAYIVVDDDYKENQYYRFDPNKLTWSFDFDNAQTSGCK